MSEEVKTETVTESVEPTEPEKVEVPEEKPAETVDDLKATVAKLEKSLKDVNKEAAERRKKLEAFEEAEKKRQEAEMSEMDKLKRQAETAEAKLAETNLALLRREIAAKYKVPEILIDRLKGKDEEEMGADAEKLMKELPKSSAKISETNPGAGASIGETDEQRFKRLFGSQN